MSEKLVGGNRSRSQTSEDKTSPIYQKAQYAGTAKSESQTLVLSEDT